MLTKTKLIAITIGTVAIISGYLILNPTTPTTEPLPTETVQHVSSAPAQRIQASSVASSIISESSASSANNIASTVAAFKEKLNALNSRQTRGDIVDWYYQQGISLDSEHLGATKSQYSTYDTATLANLVNNGDREAITETGKRLRKQGNFDAAKEKLNTAAAMGSLDALRELATQSELELNRLTRRVKSTGTTKEQLRSKQLELLAHYDALHANNDILYTQGLLNARDSKYAQYGKDLTDDDKNLIQIHLTTLNSELSNIRESLNIAEEPRAEIPASVKTYVDTLAEFMKFCAQNSGACEKP